MKGIVLSGGKGTRLRPFTYTGAKQLVPVGNKPVLFHVIEDLVEADITDIGIVIGDTGSQIREAVGDGSRFGAKVTYIPQEAPLGIAHGVKIAKDFVRDEPFVLFLGDNLIRDGIVPLVKAFRDSSQTINSLIVLKQVPNPQDFGVAICNNGKVEKLIEKPQNPPSDLAVIGIYMFDYNVFEAVENIRPSARGELEITDTIQYLIDKGLNVVPYRLDGYWTDTGKMDDILEANRWVLEVMEGNIKGKVDEASTIHGRVMIDSGAEIINSVIRGPVVIGEGTKIINSYIGPFTSIYYNCTVIDAEIEHSIVLENSKIETSGDRIVDSLIGRDVEIHKSLIKPRAHKLVLGDHSKVGIL